MYGRKSPRSKKLISESEELEDEDTEVAEAMRRAKHDSSVIKDLLDDIRKLKSENMELVNSYIR